MFYGMNMQEYNYMIAINDARNLLEIMRSYTDRYINIEDLKVLINTLGRGWTSFEENEIEQILYSDCGPNNPCTINYDINSFDGYIPGFSYKKVNKNEYLILGVYIDS